MADNVKAPESGGNELQLFLNSSNSFLENTFLAIVKAAGNSEDTALIESSCETAAVQFLRLTEAVQQAYGGVNAMNKIAVDEFVALQQGRMIAVNTERTAKAALVKGIGEGFFGWLFDNINEIKKIIRMILRMIFGTLPGWVDDLILLIDELIKLILPLLGGIFGMSRAKIANDLSRAEQNFWAELGALDKVRAIHAQTAQEAGD